MNFTVVIIDLFFGICMCSCFL